MPDEKPAIPAVVDDRFYSRRGKRVAAISLSDGAPAIVLGEDRVRALVPKLTAWLDEPRLGARRAPEIVAIDVDGGAMALVRTTFEWAALHERRPTVPPEEMASPVPQPRPAAVTGEVDVEGLTLQILDPVCPTCRISWAGIERALVRRDVAEAEAISLRARRDVVAANAALAGGVRMHAPDAEPGPVDKDALLDAYDRRLRAAHANTDAIIEEHRAEIAAREADLRLYADEIGSLHADEVTWCRDADELQRLRADRDGEVERHRGARAIALEVALSGRDAEVAKLTTQRDALRLHLDDACRYIEVACRRDQLPFKADGILGRVEEWRAALDIEAVRVVHVAARAAWHTAMRALHRAWSLLDRGSEPTADEFAKLECYVSECHLFEAVHEAMAAKRERNDLLMFLAGMSTSAPDDDALMRVFYAARDRSTAGAYGANLAGVQAVRARLVTPVDPLDRAWAACREAGLTMPPGLVEREARYREIEGELLSLDKAEPTPGWVARVRSMLAEPAPREAVALARIGTATKGLHADKAPRDGWADGVREAAAIEPEPEPDEAAIISHENSRPDAAVEAQYGALLGVDGEGSALIEEGLSKEDDRG